jgi:hypothetical protein
LENLVRPRCFASESSNGLNQLCEGYGEPDLASRWTPLRLREAKLIWSRAPVRALIGTMAERNHTSKLPWPWWSWWAVAAVVVTSLLTIAATLNDIL